MTDLECFTVKEFHAIAENKGLSKRQIRRLIENRLFPKTIKIGIARAKGCRYIYPQSAEKELELIISVKAICPDFDRMRYLLWLRGCDWVWNDLKSDLASKLRKREELQIDEAEELDRVDKTVFCSAPTYSKSLNMQIDETQTALWASHWLARTGEPYPYDSENQQSGVCDETGDGFWRPVFNKFYKNSDADWFLEWFQSIDYSEKAYILENASESFGALVRPRVIEGLKEQLSRRFPIPKGEHPFFYWLRIGIMANMILRYEWDMMILTRKDIQKALWARSISDMSCQKFEEFEDMPQ